MVYMAGDNGKAFDTAAGPKRLMAEMTTSGYKDIWKMSQVGTTGACAVTCLFDTLQGSYLVEVRKGRGMGQSLVQPLAEVNMGDPVVLRDFIVRSTRAYPAERYALVLWNHGMGWLDVDIYAQVRAASGREPGGWAPGHPPLFRSTLRRLSGGDATRPIAFDDSSKDFLDTADLRWALASASEETGTCLDLIGMDACLMAMLEGARELSPFTRWFVSSQEVEPMEGWPYRDILKAINARPAMDGRDLASSIVDEYARSYSGQARGFAPVTQSAVDLVQTEATEQLARQLVDALMIDPAPSLRAIAQRAVDGALVFQDRSYRDLGSFAAALASEAAANTHRQARPIAVAAEALRDHLAAPGAGRPVLRLACGPGYERATGLSVFLPRSLSPMRREEAMAAYRTLHFAQRTGWDRLVEWLL